MKRIIFTLLAICVCTIVQAIPAKPGFVAYTQPDASVVMVRLVGDEHGHMIYSENGRLLVIVDGYLEYAAFDSDGFPKASGIKVTKDGESSDDISKIQLSSDIDRWTGKLEERKIARLENLYTNSLLNTLSTRSYSYVPLHYGRCDTSFPVKGKQKGLVILVEYADVSFSYGSHDYFYRMLNEEGFSDYGSLGSAKDWFTFNSNGKFIPEFDVYGPVVLPNKREYYGANDVYGDDKHAYQMIIDACSLLDDDIDFSQYDRDDDGIIDNVFIFYAGYGEHDSNIENAVWPHSWYLSEACPGEEYIYDGVRLEHYACSCELMSGHKRPDGIGTFVHEFSHVMGLPDLYVTNYSRGFTPGGWSVMDEGPYNNDGLTPPNFSSFEKSALGWIEFVAVREGINELPDFSASNMACFLPTDNEDEFYFFENRQQTGNDKFLPGHGMLVWHVDYDAYAWEMNTVNNNRNHQRVDLIEADDVKSEYTRDGDSFPGSNNITKLGFDTSPQLACWSKQPLEYDLQEIAESEEGIIRFYAVERESSVGSVGKDMRDDVYYDLMGRRVDHPGKGIYILNGKKIVLN